MLRETYSKDKFNKISSTYQGQVQTVGGGRLDKILQARDNALHDKKAEICELREKLADSIKEKHGKANTY